MKSENSIGNGVQLDFCCLSENCSGVIKFDLAEYLLF